MVLSLRLGLFSLGLGLVIEAQTFSVSVSSLRLRPFQSWSQSCHWDSDIFGLGFSFNDPNRVLLIPDWLLVSFLFRSSGYNYDLKWNCGNVAHKLRFFLFIVYIRLFCYILCLCIYYQVNNYQVSIICIYYQVSSINNQLLSMINYQLRSIKYQQVLYIKYQLSSINDKISSINYQTLIIKYQSSSMDYQLIIIKYRLSSINYQVSSINKPRSIVK